MRIRPETPSDEPVVREVVRAAFGGDRVPDLVAAMRESVAWLGLSFVAEQDGEVVGHVSYTRAWVDAPTGWSTCSCSARSRCVPTGSGRASAPRW